MSRHRRLRVSLRSSLRRRVRWHNRRSRIARRQASEEAWVTLEDRGGIVIYDELDRFRRG